MKKIVVKCVRKTPIYKRLYKCTNCGIVSEKDVELDDILLYKCKKCGGEVEKHCDIVGWREELKKETVCEVLKKWVKHEWSTFGSSEYSEGGLVRDSGDVEILLKKVLVRLPFRRWTCVLVLDKDEKRVLWVEDKHGTVDRRFFGREDAYDELIVEHA